jgi:hypothetical protein
MIPNPRIHRPTARSYVAGYSSLPTITQSTALWKAMRHREELERQRAANAADAANGPLARFKRALLSLRSLRLRS